MNPFKEQELVLCIGNPHQYAITQGNVYAVIKTGTRYTRVTGDNGEEQKLLHRHASESFKRIQLPPLQSSVGRAGVARPWMDTRLEHLRAANRTCECGAWIVRGGHSSYCPAVKGETHAA